MKKVVEMTLAAIFMASAASAQTQTDTRCSTSSDNGLGHTTDCKSTTEPVPQPNGGWLKDVLDGLAAKQKRAEAKRENAQNSQQAPQLSAEAIKELLAEEKKEKDAKDTVDFIYCRQNPKGGIADSEGKPKPCADVIEYTKAFCSVNPEVERCTLAKSKAEVEKAFSVLSDDYKTDPRRNKRDAQMYYDSLFAKLTKWGCMSFPDMTLPQRDGTHPCPNAPEPAPVH